MKPTAPGVYRFRLSADPIVAWNSASSDDAREIEVVVTAPIVADAGPDCLLKIGDDAVWLGRCQSPERPTPQDGINERWRLVSGPTNPDVTCVDRGACLFKPTTPGVYVFELSASNGTTIKRDEVTYLVRDKLRVSLAEDDLLAVPGDRIRLRPSVGFDVFDPHPLVHWGLKEGNPNAILLDETNPGTLLATPLGPGEYRFAVNVRARRDLGGRVFWDEETAEVRALVANPGLLLSLQSAGAIIGKSSLSAKEPGYGAWMPVEVTLKYDVWSFWRIGGFGKLAGLGLHAGLGWGLTAPRIDIPATGWPLVTVAPNLKLSLPNIVDGHFYVGVVGRKVLMDDAIKGFEYGGDLAWPLGGRLALVTSVRGRFLWWSTPIPTLSGATAEAEVAIGIGGRFLGPRGVLDAGEERKSP